MPGLSVSNVTNVSVVMTPLAVPQRNFGVLLIVGPSSVIDTAERFRQYATMESVAADFGTTVPEYLAANLFFSQNPRPAILLIGRWAQAATAGLLKGGALSATQQTLANFTAITTGAFSITFDGGTATNVSAVNLSSAVNLNGVASIIDAALPAGVNFVWNASRSRFDCSSATTGAASTVSFMSATALSAALRGTAALGASAVAGIVVETPVAAVTIMDNATGADFYGVMFAPVAAADVSQAAHVAVSAYVEATTRRHIYGVNTQDAGVLDPAVTSDIASVMKAANYNRTFSQYSSSSLYAVASMFGRAFTVDFTANNTMITLKFKIEPGVTAETISETAASTLASKNCNVFVNYDNSSAIIQQGEMASGFFFDEMHGTDWLQNLVQTNRFNLLYTSPTKIPQTDAGMNVLMSGDAQAMEAGVHNGLIAPGVWNGPPIGGLKTGQLLPSGYYIYTPPIAKQAQATREARIAPTTQIAIKMAGAIHSADVIINVNR